MTAPKTLKSRINALFNALGGPEAGRPNPAKVRSELALFAGLAETLEDGAAAAEKEAIIATLNAENDNLKVELRAAKSEIKRYQAERTKQEEREREIPPIQFKILSLLPNEHKGNWLRIDEISRAAKIPSDEAEVHANKLKKAGLVISRFGAYDALVWHRSNEGNELVIARRLAGDEEAQTEKSKPRTKYADLSKTEHVALLMIASKGEEGITADEIAEKIEGGATVPMVQLILVLLEEKGMASDGDEPDYGAGRYWTLLRNGSEYLAERGQL